MTKRLDAVVAERGLARSRTHAAQLIDAGLVSVDGRPVVKAATRVGDEQDVVVAASDHYVSRAAHKLIAALDAFRIDVSGRLCLDMGASTGGFTQVLRERGAARVLAVDVGHGQLAPQIAADSGVSVVEGFNVRYMTPESLAKAIGGDPISATAPESTNPLPICAKPRRAAAAPAFSGKAAMARVVRSGVTMASAKANTATGAITVT